MNEPYAEYTVLPSKNFPRPPKYPLSFHQKITCHSPLKEQKENRPPATRWYFDPSQFYFCRRFVMVVEAGEEFEIVVGIVGIRTVLVVIQPPSPI